MSNVNNTIKASLLCLALTGIALAGTVTQSTLSHNATTPSFSSRLVTGDGQETHGGKGGTKLVCGDGQETHGGGKGTA